ncbi:hypothetical protein [Deinococcus fonticola]|uniref:hypothetical protein n=1 Tax=Deinococcus fonticola TaxID=2528713 RepID=UPI00107536D8|nr:hypothetical protein [Deinococcus fonticola]
MKTKRPAQFDPVLWAVLGHAGRLEVMALHARTPERREQLRRAAMQHTAQQLDRAVKKLERVTQEKRGSAYEY